ncbi:MAG: response regulator [Magnetococcales bacterium]|nr:response regulator [Magnetococcales bacterium]
MRILIVDDEQNNRIVLHQLLAAWGQCDLVQDGTEAVEAFELSSADGQPYDLICMDLFMQRMNGDQALRAIRAEEERLAIPAQYRCFVIIITGHEPTGGENWMQGDTCTVTLLKPVTRVKLHETLTENGFFPPEAVAGAVHQADSPDQPQLSPIPGVDLDDALDRVMGNARLFQELLSNFLHAHGNDLQKLQAALDGDNPELPLRLLHTLKGAAGNIGAIRLHLATRTLETACRNRLTPAERAAPMAEFTAAMNEIMTGLQNAVPAHRVQ